MPYDVVRLISGYVPLGLDERYTKWLEPLLKRRDVIPHQAMPLPSECEYDAIIQYMFGYGCCRHDQEKPAYNPKHWSPITLSEMMSQLELMYHRKVYNERRKARNQVLTDTKINKQQAIAETERLPPEIASYFAELRSGLASVMDDNHAVLEQWHNGTGNLKLVAVQWDALRYRIDCDPNKILSS